MRQGAPPGAEGAPIDPRCNRFGAVRSDKATCLPILFHTDNPDSLTMLRTDADSTSSPVYLKSLHGTAFLALFLASTLLAGKAAWSQEAAQGTPVGEKEEAAEEEGGGDRQGRGLHGRHFYNGGVDNRRVAARAALREGVGRSGRRSQLRRAAHPGRRGHGRHPAHPDPVVQHPAPRHRRRGDPGATRHPAGPAAGTTCWFSSTASGAIAPASSPCWAARSIQVPRVRI